MIALGVGEALPGRPRLVHELVDEVALRSPARIAVESGDDVVDYGSLNAWSARLAARLVAAGVRLGSRVALFIEPSTAMVGALLAVLRSGAAYVPLDQSQPRRRIAEVLTDAGVVAAVSAGHYADSLAELGLPVVRADLDLESDATFQSRVTSDDAAYLIYTSGSTGEPKGVVVEHGQLAASTMARRIVYRGAATFLLVSPLASDSSAAGLWGTLTSGGRLVVAKFEEARDPERLIGLIERHGVTRMLCVPSLYGAILDVAARIGGDGLRTLETVIVAGESLPDTLVERHFAVQRGSVALVNEYGPTEATIWASYHRFDGPGRVSIGRPIPGARLYLLDKALQPVPAGVEAELFIGGHGVARGYHGRRDATARSFLPDPFSGPSAQMYRTGDLARWNDDGTLHFIGRRDHQVKIRGYRVELDAVEAALRRVQGVRDAVVVPNETRTSLMGFIVTSSVLSSESVRRELADQLPDVMVPTSIRMVDQFPLTVTGKVDRSALARLIEESPLHREPPSPAGNGASMTARVAAAWSQVLRLASVPTDVNFFDLGGNSLAMFELQDALEQQTGTRPSVVALYRHTTVAAQARAISDSDSQPRGSLGESRARPARRADLESGSQQIEHRGTG